MNNQYTYRINNEHPIRVPNASYTQAPISPTFPHQKKSVPVIFREIPKTQEIINPPPFLTIPPTNSIYYSRDRMIKQEPKRQHSEYFKRATDPF